MERTGDFHDFKRQIVELVPQISTFQQAFLQMIGQTSSASESAALIRVLLLSSYLLLRIGLHSFIPLEDLIDLSLCFFKEHMNDDALLSELLRLLQTLLMVMTRNGELMLNCDLFPYLMRFLTSETVLQQVSRGDLRIQSWYFVCIDYLSFDPSHQTSVSTLPPRDSPRFPRFHRVIHCFKGWNQQNPNRFLWVAIAFARCFLANGTGDSVPTLQTR